MDTNIEFDDVKICPECGEPMTTEWLGTGQYFSYETGQIEEDGDLFWVCGNCSHVERYEELPF